MVLIKRAAPDILLGFVISNISSSTINQAIADFKLGAYHEYDPLVELSLDQTRFVGSSPKQVRDQLDAEDVRESFILLDDETTLSRSVWWVGRYLDEEMEGPDADHWREMRVVNASKDERILMRARFATIEVPSFKVNDAIGNMCIFDILDMLPGPYDPHGLPEPCTMADWEQDPPPPPPAYIVATQDEYEKSSEAEHTQKWHLPTGPATEVVRLKEAVAKENNLRSEWTLIEIAPHVEEGLPEGSLAFSQPWATRK